jgi:hypothetical protein
VTKRFSRMPIAAAADRRLGATELRVLIALGASANKDGICWPSQTTISRIAGVDRRKVHATLSKLAATGHAIKIESAAGRSATYKLNYELSPGEAAALSPGEVADDEATVAWESDQLPPGEAANYRLGRRTNSLGTAQVEQPRERGARGTRFPADAILPDDWRQWAQQERPDVDPDQVFERFKDYWIAKPGKDGSKSNWTATWRNWVRRERAPSSRGGTTIADKLAANIRKADGDE